MSLRAERNVRQARAPARPPGTFPQREKDWAHEAAEGFLVFLDQWLERPRVRANSAALIPERASLPPGSDTHCQATFDGYRWRCIVLDAGNALRAGSSGIEPVA